MAGRREVNWIFPSQPVLKSKSFVDERLRVDILFPFLAFLHMFSPSCVRGSLYGSQLSLDCHYSVQNASTFGTGIRPCSALLNNLDCTHHCKNVRLTYLFHHTKKIANPPPAKFCHDIGVSQSVTLTSTFDVYRTTCGQWRCVSFPDDVDATLKQA